MQATTSDNMSDSRSNLERGSVLLGVLVTTMALSAIGFMSTLLVKTEIKESRRSFDELKTLAIAEAGFERTVHQLRDAIKKTAFIDPLLGVKALLDDGKGGYKTYLPFTAEAVMDGANKIGEFSISVTAIDRDNGLDIEITSIGYFPASAANLPAGSPAPTKRTIKATIRLETKPSSVFDYAYFINNWGWFYGNTIFANGNARSNGQFDVAGYAPTVTGQPMYDDIVWKSGKVDLLGYRDDNNDGKMDGLDGGIFSGWDIVNAKNVKGEGGKAKNQHDFEENIPMPNLTNLDQYEKIAIDEDGEIRVGNMKIFEGVLGDDPGEKQNLYLIGTTSKPIKITGTVVVRGDVIIAGVVTGEGAIYSGGNIYVPNDITYKNGPLAARPKDNTELETEVWLQANQNKDILGLFATENIVVGDVTNSTWRFYVSSWLSNPMNASEEDAGADQIPNTKKGKDGKLNTADDDVLENDNIWTVERYTAYDLAKGLIPPGKSVNDPIPGTGEDIDGDGKYDGTITLSDLDFKGPLNKGTWAGNMPEEGISDYSTIADMAITNLDANFYTNHAFAWTTLPWIKPVNVNGSIVSRNESIIYGAPALNLNYDTRVVAGNGVASGMVIPRVAAPITIISWSIVE